MHNHTGASFQIVVAGIPRSNRDTKAAALEAAEYLRTRNAKVGTGPQDRRERQVADSPFPPVDRSRRRV